MARPRVALKTPGVRSLLKDDGVAAFLEGRMRAALAEAVSNAPVVSGDYQRSLSLETVDNPTRKVVRLVADVDYALVVEAKTGNLARALDAAGGRP